MNVLVLMGSPRKEGNTAALLQPFCEELTRGGAMVETIRLYDCNIKPCVACRACESSCPQKIAVADVLADFAAQRAESAEKR